MEPLGTGIDPTPAPVHTVPNYVLAVAAIGILLFAAGAFGIIRNERRVNAPRKPAEHIAASVQEVQQTAPTWVRYADLTVPEGMRVYNDCGEQDCGETVGISYDGTIPPGKLPFIFPQNNIAWPDLRMTALSRSPKLVYLNPDTDKTTLEVTPTGSYARDTNHVYYLKCGTYGCAYNALTGMNPATFDPSTYAPIQPH